MSLQNLWSAGGIIATLFSPFGPAMGTRFVNSARHTRFFGPVLDYFFPEEEGPHPIQRDGEPQVGLNADSTVLLCDALRDAVQGGLEAAGFNSDLIGEIRKQNALLQQLVDAVEGMREDATNRHADTYIATSTIARAYYMWCRLTAGSYQRRPWFQQPGRISDGLALLRSADDE